MQNDKTQTENYVISNINDYQFGTCKARAAPLIEEIKIELLFEKE